MQIRQKTATNMKYRIRETINGDDVSTFRVQKKILWWWDDEGAPWYDKKAAEDWIGVIIDRSRKNKVKEVKYHTVEQ